MWRACLIVLACGCQQSGGDDYPPLGGGGGGGGIGGGADAAVDGNDGGGEPVILGRVCLVEDLRAVAVAESAPAMACDDVSAGGLLVTVGTRAAITELDGRFAIGVPSGTNLTWRVTGPNIVSSVMGFGAIAVIPAIEEARYIELLSANLATLAQDQGSIVVRLVRSGQAVAGAVASLESPPPSNPTFYDDESDTLWDLDSTGALGLAWLPGVDIGLAQVAITATGSAVATVPAEDQAITYATIELP